MDVKTIIMGQIFIQTKFVFWVWWESYLKVICTLLFKLFTYMIDFVFLLQRFWQPLKGFNTSTNWRENKIFFYKGGKSSPKFNVGRGAYPEPWHFLHMLYPNKSVFMLRIKGGIKKGVGLRSQNYFYLCTLTFFAYAW